MSDVAPLARRIIFLMKETEKLRSDVSEGQQRKRTMSLPDVAPLLRRIMFLMEETENLREHKEDSEEAKKRWNLRHKELVNTIKEFEAENEKTQEYLRQLVRPTAQSVPSSGSKRKRTNGDMPEAKRQRRETTQSDDVSAVYGNKLSTIYRRLRDEIDTLSVPVPPIPNFSPTRHLQTHDRNSFALKRTTLSFDDPEYLFREAVILCRLRDCPHIVSLQAVERRPDDHSLCGLVLERLVYKNTDVKTQACHALQGLMECHAAGVVHGDVKPEHVMYSTKDSCYKLVDFGLACPDQAVGTKEFMAPEVASGSVPDKASDMWSLGVSMVSFCFPQARWSSWQEFRSQFRRIPAQTDPNFNRVLFIASKLLDENPEGRPTAEQAHRMLCAN